MNPLITILKPDEEYPQIVRSNKCRLINVFPAVLRLLQEYQLYYDNKWLEKCILHWAINNRIW